MQTISKTAARVLEILTAGLEPGASRHVGEKGGTYMQVVVERLTEDRFSISHYYRQNGDLCPDPDMEFYRFEAGEWAPVSITQWCGTSRAMEFDSEGLPSRWSPSRLRELCSFTGTWMKNIRAQQDLKAI